MTGILREGKKGRAVLIASGAAIAKYDKSDTSNPSDPHPQTPQTATPTAFYHSTQRAATGVKLIGDGGEEAMRIYDLRLTLTQ